MILVGLQLHALHSTNSHNITPNWITERFRRDADYPADKLVDVDLHNDQFCVDISSYGPVQWVERTNDPDTYELYQECATPFVKKCEDKSENVCKEVVETKCQVVPYTECAMGLAPVEFTQTVLNPKSFSPQECVTKREEIPHRKMLPECRNVTKQNCVSNWQVDPYGKQVWAGNEECEPVTWQECKLVPRDVKFVVPKVECSPTAPIWYHVPESVTDVRMTNTLTCVVKSTTDCKVTPRQDCKYVKYQECKEVPVPGCQPAKVHAPTQERIHRKKCLLPDNPSPVKSDYGSPAAPPLPSYAPVLSYTPVPSYTPSK